MSETMSKDPADHPIAEERVGFVDGQIMFIHAAQTAAGRVWSDRAGDVVVPIWVRDLTSLLHIVELSNALADETIPGGAHRAAAALSNWRAGLGDARLEGMARQLEQARKVFQAREGASC